jgi:hypothetical protein
MEHDLVVGRVRFVTVRLPVRPMKMHFDVARDLPAIQPQPGAAEIRPAEQIPGAG